VQGSPMSRTRDPTPLWRLAMAPPARPLAPHIHLMYSPPAPSGPVLTWGMGFTLSPAQIPLATNCPRSTSTTLTEPNWTQPWRGALIRLRNNTTNSRPAEWGGGEALELDSEQSQPREQTAQAIAGWLPTRGGRDRARCGARGRISAPRQSSPVAARGAAWEEAKGDAPPRRKAAWFSVQPFAGGEVADDRFWRRRISGEREGQSEREREREEGNPPPEFAVFRYHPCVHGGTARRLG
jgi:hypothetical protein